MEDVDEARLAVEKAEKGLARAREVLRRAKDRVAGSKERVQADKTRAYLARQRELTDRRKAMLAYYREGNTYAATGLAFGIGGQRAAQVIEKAKREELEARLCGQSVDIYGKQLKY